LNIRSIDITRNFNKANDYLSGIFNNCYHSDDLIKDFRLEAAYDAISSGLSELESGVLDVYKKSDLLQGCPAKKMFQILYITKYLKPFQNFIMNCLSWAG